MTTAEMLAEITAQIRKDIPRLMELKEGCYLMNHASEKMYKIINVDGEICFLVDVDNYKLSLLEITKSTAENYFKTIGHDILLNDVLRWLEFIRTRYEYISYLNFDIKNNMFRMFATEEVACTTSLDGCRDIVTYAEWDLSKPPLKDQSKELIEFLYNTKNQ